MPPEVLVSDEQSDHPVEMLRWARLGRAVLEAEGLAGDAEMSVIFVDEEAIAELNRRFAGDDRPTDVLAFPIDEIAASGPPSNSRSTGPAWSPPEARDLPTLVGDVFICPAVARRNAEAAGTTLDEELALLLVHGVLHLTGHDHAVEAEAVAMRNRERELLERFHATAETAEEGAQ